MSEQPTELNGLQLEYQRDYGTARRDLDVTNLINNYAAITHSVRLGPSKKRLGMSAFRDWSSLPLHQLF